MWVIDLLAHRVLLRQLRTQLSFLGLCCQVRSYALCSEEVKQLVWHFSEGLLGKKHRVVLVFSEGNELYNVRIHVLTILLAVERGLVCIELVHRLKISCANSHNNDREWKLRASYNLIDRFLHIVDNTICDNQQDVVLLINLCDLHALRHLVNKVNDLGKVCRTIQIYALNCVFVRLHDTVQPVTLRVENITVQGETVLSCGPIRWNRSTKTEGWYLLVTVVVLENAADRSDRVKIFIFRKVEVVERLWIAWHSIRHREIYSDRKPDFTASKDEVKEAEPGLKLKFVELKKSCSFSLTFSIGNHKFLLARSHLGDCHIDVAKILVLTAFSRLEKFDFKFVVNVSSVHDISGQQV